MLFANSAFLSMVFRKLTQCYLNTTVLIWLKDSPFVISRMTPRIVVVSPRCIFLVKEGFQGTVLARVSRPVSDFVNYSQKEVIKFRLGALR